MTLDDAAFLGVVLYAAVMTLIAAGLNERVASLTSAQARGVLTPKGVAQDALEDLKARAQVQSLPWEEALGRPAKQARDEHGRFIKRVA